MRLTVGPLPSAVYWRRRAIVLGALFIVLLVLFTTCRGGDGSGAAKTSASSTPTASTSEAPATPDAEQPPTGSPTLAPTTGAPAAPPVATTGAPAQPKGGCTDAEIKVTAVPTLTSAPAGQTIVLKLRIKNESDRECSRDVGPDEQELYIKKGAQVIWSSDKCSTYRGSEVKPFPRDHEMEFQATWNGRQSTDCDNGAATGSAPDPGEYQVIGRLGTDLSAPVKLTLT
jgi:hypothetical protein